MTTRNTPVAAAPLCSVFRIGDLVFVLEIEHVQEVLQPQAVTPVPMAPPIMAGLVNLRGDIVPAVDLRPALGLAPGDSAAAMQVVVASESGAFSLIVDEVRDIVGIPIEAFGPVPAHVPRELRPVARSLCKLPDSLLWALDVPGVTRLVDSLTPA